MAIELTSAPENTINSIRASLSAADSRVFLTQDNNSSTGSRVVCNTNLGQVKLAAPVSDTQLFEEGGSYTSAEWSNQGGAGTVVFVGSTNSFNSFVNNILGNVDSSSLKVQFNNDGNLLPVNYWGYSGSDVSVTTFDFPENPVAVTSVRFHFTFINRVVLDVDDSTYEIKVYDNTLNIESTRDVTIEAGDDLRLYSNDVLSLRNRSNDSITFHTNYDNSGEKFWELYPDGTTEVPSHLIFRNDGNYNASGSIKTHPLSSGDGFGYTTMELHPDNSRSASDQYLIIDPTAGMPPHIHIRAGGTQDASQADLFLGGENSHVKVGAGANPPITIASNNNNFIFNSDGSLIFPDSTAQSTAYKIGQLTVLLSANTEVGAEGYTVESLSGANVIVFAPEEGYTDSAFHTVTIPAPNYAGQRLTLLNVYSQGTVTVNWPIQNDGNLSTSIESGYNKDLTALITPDQGLIWWETNSYNWGV